MLFSSVSQWATCDSFQEVCTTSRANGTTQELQSPHKLPTGWIIDAVQTETDALILYSLLMKIIVDYRIRWIRNHGAFTKENKQKICMAGYLSRPVSLVLPRFLCKPKFIILKFRPFWFGLNYNSIKELVRLVKAVINYYLLSMINDFIGIFPWLMLIHIYEQSFFTVYFPCSWDSRGYLLVWESFLLTL